MRIIVVRRPSIEWDKVSSLDDFQLMHNVKKESILRWERLYSTSWIGYRKELAKIAKTTTSSYINIRAEDILNLSGNDDCNRFTKASFKENCSLFDNDFLLPIDDDDWIYPNLRFDTNIAVHFWNCVVFESVISGNFHFWHPHHPEFCSNGYCVRYVNLKKLSPQDLVNILLYHDSAAIVTFKNHLQWRYSDKPFGVYLRHCGSGSVINQSEIASSELPQRQSCPATWAIPQIEKFEELFYRLDKKELKLL